MFKNSYHNLLSSSITDQDKIIDLADIIGLQDATWQTFTEYRYTNIENKWKQKVLK